LQRRVESALSQCIRSFLDVMKEADDLVTADSTGAKLADVLHFASDLLDIIAEELRGLHAEGVAVPDVALLRDKLNEARAMLGPATLH
jgi:hypothetical protein